MIRIFVSFLILAALLESVVAAIFHKSIRRAGFRVAAALRNTRPRAAKEQLERSSQSLISFMEGIGGCEVNLCFALEGSGEISREQYELQELFSVIASAIISADNAATFSALQYSMTTSPIVSKTADFYHFLNKVRASVPEGEDLINMSAALGACGEELRDDKTKKGVIVIMGSGRSSIGFDPDSVADVVTKTTSIISLSTSGSTLPFVQSLGVRKDDVHVIGSLEDFEAALRKTVPSICR